MNKVVLTGDRPTGPLHLGHYVGSLANRLMLQERYDQFIMIADMQALTDNFETPQKVRDNVFQVALDYLAIGIDPDKTTVFIQSLIPQIAELTMYYLNLVTVARLQRNPTVKSEIQQREFGKSIPVGFFVYPVSQAADITSVKGQIVPVGEDQLPMIEQTNEIVRSFNRIYDCKILLECEAIVPKIARLPGTDGKSKMSKSLGNAIFLSDDSDTVAKKVMSMYTDPEHTRIDYPGKIEGNVVFNYLDIFDGLTQEVQELKMHYQQGGLGDVKLKKRLIEVLEAFLTPIRIRRKEFAQDPLYVMNILFKGTDRTQGIAEKTIQEVRKVMCLDYRQS